jgi:hypothetical protein
MDIYYLECPIKGKFWKFIIANPDLTETILVIFAICVHPWR